LPKTASHSMSKCRPYVRTRGTAIAVGRALCGLIAILHVKFVSTLTRYIHVQVHITHANRYSQFGYSSNIVRICDNRRAALISLQNAYKYIDIKTFLHLSSKHMDKRSCRWKLFIRQTSQQCLII